MKRPTLLFFLWLLSTCGASFAPRILLAQDTTFHAEVRSPAATAGPAAGGIVPFTIELEQAAMVPVEAGILLDSRISACLRQPSPCDGAENFSNPEELVFGCSDTIDNDSDGKTDLDDEDCVAVQGWSISVATANCFNLGPNTGPLSMRGATTDGTVAALRSAGGMRDPEGNFAQTEVISPNNNGGQQGAVSAIVLSLQAPVFLPQVSENNLVLRLRGNIDASGLTEGQETAPCLVRILGPEEAGLRGSGEPVQTAVTVGGGTDLPNIRNATIKVVLPGEPPPPTEAQTTFKVSVAQPAATAGPKEGNVIPYLVQLAAPQAGVPTIVDISLVSRIQACLEQPSPCNGAENFHNVEEGVFGCKDDVDNDSDGKTDLDDEDCVAVQGWSISVATADCFRLGPNTGPLSMRGTTTDGTVSALSTAGGLRDPEGNFAQTEVINPANNGGQQGAVSAIVLSLQNPIFLPQISESIVLKLRGNIDTSALTQPGNMTAPCLVTILPPDNAGLRGSGEPVQTAVTIGGGTDMPIQCNGSIKVNLQGGPQPQPKFRRGDPNDDRKVNIADPIWIINDLFRQGPESACQDAADANNDGMVDLSDVNYLIMYQFQGGSAPPAPFTNCGEDPATPADTLACDPLRIRSCPQ